MNSKIAVIGEGVIDRFVEAGQIRDVIGGSPLNTAVAMRRAGANATWWAKVSNGAEGSAILDYAEQNSVRGEKTLTSQLPCPIVIISLNSEGVPAYDFALDGAADWSWTLADLAGLDEMDAVQVGSLTTVIEPGCTAIRTKLMELHALQNRPLISFDPNARPNAAKDNEDADRMRETISSVIQLADLVKVSDEDLDWFDSSVEPIETAKKWSRGYPKLVVMTRGGDGAIAIVNGEVVAQTPGVRVDVVDTVGAGDTFMAWLLTGVLQSETFPATPAEIQPLLEKAAAAAAITCSRKGCNPPYASEL